MKLDPSPYCDCPNCYFTVQDKKTGALNKERKEFSYPDPDNLPHKSTAFDYKFFSFSVKDREKIDLYGLKGHKDAEEISTILYNLYHKDGLEAVEEFIKKSGIDEIIRKNREKMEELNLKNLINYG